MKRKKEKAMTEVNLTKKELLLAAQLLKMAGETYSRNICSHFNLAEVGLNKEERLALMEKVAAWSGDPEFRECIPYEVQYDWMLMKCLAHELEKAVKSEENQPQPKKKIDIVFDRPPGHHGPRFIEVEVEGRSVSLGKWIERNGVERWTLTFGVDDVIRCLGEPTKEGPTGPVGSGLCPTGEPVRAGVDAATGLKRSLREANERVRELENELATANSQWENMRQERDELKKTEEGPVEATESDDTPWHESTDGLVWAEQFVKHKKDNNWTIDDIDDGLLLGWFSNAMEAVRDQMQRQMEDIARSRDDAEKGLETQNTCFNELQLECNELRDLYALACKRLKELGETEVLLQPKSQDEPMRRTKRSLEEAALEEKNGLDNARRRFQQTDNAENATTAEHVTACHQYIAKLEKENELQRLRGLSEGLYEFVMKRKETEKAMSLTESTMKVITDLEAKVTHLEQWARNVESNRAIVERERDELRQKIEGPLDEKNLGMNVVEAAKKACEEPTLSEALSWIAVWENDRAVKQALENTKTGNLTGSHHGGLWDTCFGVCFDKILELYPVWKKVFHMKTNGPMDPKMTVAFCHGEGPQVWLDELPEGALWCPHCIEVWESVHDKKWPKPELVAE